MFEFFDIRIALIGIGFAIVYFSFLLTLAALYPGKFKTNKRARDYILEFKIGKAFKTVLVGWGFKAFAAFALAGLIGGSGVAALAVVVLSAIATFTIGGIDPSSVTLGWLEFFADVGVGEALVDEFPDFFAGLATIIAAVSGAWMWGHSHPWVIALKGQCNIAWSALQRLRDKIQTGENS